MKITWLGQSGYLFEHRGQRLVIDPFFSNIVLEKQGISRLMAPPMEVSDLNPGVAFITHDHLDHFDPITLAEIHKEFPTCQIAGPESVMDHAMKLDFYTSALVPMPKGVKKKFREFSIITISADHPDPYAVGLIVNVASKTIYVSGDTLYSYSLVEEINSVTNGLIDIAFVVINGQLGNMNVQEAIELVERIQPDIAIPMHYGMFADNTEDPSRFLKGLDNSNINAMEMTIGNEIEL